MQAILIGNARSSHSRLFPDARTRFTRSAYALPLTALAAASVVGAGALRVSFATPFVIAVVQLASQLAVNLIKNAFARPRPPVWLFRREPGRSYPSGHATTAAVFYGGWAVALWSSSAALPVRAGGTALLLVWALGIGWSRVALGAHYVTDVAGGYVFGTGNVALTLAAA